MSMLGTKQPVYNDGRTKQSFRDETDINKLLKRAQKSGTISHLNKYEGRYADFSNFDFLEAQIRLTAGREIFDELPSEIRSEFNQSPEDFFAYVNDPENVDRLGTLLPGLAAPGRQNLSINPPTADEARAIEESANPGSPGEAESASEGPPGAPESPTGGPAETSSSVT